MRKITPVLESELPKLPDGWRWRKLPETWFAFCAEIDVYMEESGILVVFEDESIPVPFEVISAVLKANGVEL